MAPQVHVLGFKREIAFSASTVAQIVEGRIAEGTLVVVTKDRIQAAPPHLTHTRDSWWACATMWQNRARRSEN